MALQQSASLHVSSTSTQVARARQNLCPSVEEAISQQIRNELSASYAYLAMANHFDRVEVAMPGAYSFFAKQSVEEREHATKLIGYVNSRGGKVKLFSLTEPQQQEWDSLHAALLDALALEKMNNQNLLNLHKLASEHSDPDLTNFLEEFYLREQVDEIQRLARMANQLRRMGINGLGEHLFDQELLQRQTKSDEKSE